MKFGDILRELLEEHDISQKDAANELHIAASTLGNYIRNIREPDYETLKNIASYFHVSTDYLLDHHQIEERTHNDDRLLQLFHTLSPGERDLFMKQGVLLVKYSRGEKK